MIAVPTSDRIMAFRFLFGIFAILMLPFASVLLSANFRSRLGTRRVIPSLIVLLVLLPAILALVTPELIKSSYIRFMEKDQKYYAKFASACDLILQQHPLGTNATLVPVAGSDAPYVFIRIPGNDPSVPEIIRAWHPSQLTVSSNCVGILVGVRDFDISWRLQEGDTNSWALSVSGEGAGGVVYAENR